MSDQSGEKMIRWEPSIFVPDLGVIKLTLDQVRDIVAYRAANAPSSTPAIPE